MELPQNLLQTFTCVASEKILTTKNGVASKFCANFYWCSIRKKNFIPKMELPQNFVQTFTFAINFVTNLAPMLIQHISTYNSYWMKIMYI